MRITRLLGRQLYSRHPIFSKTVRHGQTDIARPASSQARGVEGPPDGILRAALAAIGFQRNMGASEMRYAKATGQIPERFDTCVRFLGLAFNLSNLFCGACPRRRGCVLLGQIAGPWSCRAAQENHSVCRSLSSYSSNP
jgi:hypothetical protein